MGPGPDQPPSVEINRKLKLISMFKSWVVSIYRIG